MYRWGNCPGSVKLSENIQSVSSTHALEGTKAHEIAERVLRSGQWPNDIDADMRDAIQVYVEYIHKLQAQYPDGQIYIEHKFDLSEIYLGCFGTSDCVFYVPSLKKLYVIDYKHGSGIAVEAVDNLQLQYYGLGSLLAFKSPCEEVELVIVQPRCFHAEGPIRRWNIKAVDLLEFAGELKEKAFATEDPDAKLNPGKWCRFCPAKAVCPKLAEKAMSAAQEEFRTELSYDPAKLAQALIDVEAVEAWVKGVREFAYAEAQHGRCPPGFKLVEKRATRKWMSGLDPKALAKTCKLKLSDISENKIKSPAQIEKLLGKGGKPLIADFVTSESSGYALALESDPRPAARRDAMSEFEPVITDETD